MVGVLQGDGDQGAGLQVHRMLSFVGQVRPTIFHLRDLHVGIPRIFPIFVRGFLLALAVQARQVLARRRRDPQGLRETGQELLIARPGVAAHDATHGRVRLEHGAVNRDRLALETNRMSRPTEQPRCGLLFVIGLEYSQRKGTGWCSKLDSNSRSRVYAKMAHDIADAVSWTPRPPNPTVCVTIMREERPDHARVICPERFTRSWDRKIGYLERLSFLCQRFYLD